MTLIHNERTKLLANALDRASTASLALGGIAPVAAVLYAGTPTRPLVLLLGASLWVLAAVTLHWFAHRVLGRLRS